MVPKRDASKRANELVVARRRSSSLSYASNERAFPTRASFFIT